MRFILAIALCFGCSPGPGLAIEMADIQAMIDQLDDDRFIVRQQAAADLAKIGAPAIPKLAAAAAGGSVEQRARAADILRSIRSRSLARGFRDLGAKTEQDAADIERAMVLIAQILDPEVTAESVAARLDEVAGAVRDSLGEEVDPKSLGGAQAVAAITGTLKNKYGLKGDSENYDQPSNSSIHRVFEQKDGLPILLSEIAVAVGRRLDVPLVGVPVPRNYMFKYDGARAPAGREEDDVIVNAFGGWEVVTPQDIAQEWIYHQGELEASEPRATIERMLNNLINDLEGAGARSRSQAAQKYRSLFLGTDWQDER